MNSRYRYTSMSFFRRWLHFLQLLSFSLLFVLAGCPSNNDDQNQGSHSTQQRYQALRCMNEGKYLVAEKLLKNVLSTDVQQADLGQRSEDLLNLGKSQSQIGKLREALSSFSQAWEHFRLTGKRNLEIETMIEIATVYRKAGDPEKARDLIADASIVAGVFQDSASLLPLNLIIADIDEYHQNLEEARGCLEKSLPLARRQADQSVRISILNHLGKIVAKAGEKQIAESYLNQAGIGIDAIEDTLSKINCLLDQSDALILMNHLAEAKVILSDASALFSTLSNVSPVERISTDIHISLCFAELYIQNYAFTLARKHLVDAYTIAKDHGMTRYLGYLLLAIADCDLKMDAIAPSEEQEKQAGEFIEQAANLFSRIGDSFGHAIALVRLAARAEISGESERALQLYRDVFDIIDNRINPEPVYITESLFEKIRQVTLHQRLFGMGEDYWYASLVSFLARTGKYNEALWVLERGSLKKFQRKLRVVSFDYTDQDLQQLIRHCHGLYQQLGIIDAELTIQRMMDPINRDHLVLQQTQEEFQSLSKSLNTLGSTAAGKYPRCELLFQSVTLQPDLLCSALPQWTTLCEYVLLDDRIIVLIVSDGGITSIDVPVYRDLLLEKASRFQQCLSEDVREGTTPAGQYYTISSLSRDLYGYLIRPIEQYIDRRVIFVPPPELRGFPLHALSATGTSPLIESFDISYLPSASLAISSIPSQQTYSLVAAVGNPTGKDWDLELEFRTIRSLFPQARIFGGTQATAERLNATMGDVLYLATRFSSSTDLTRSTFTLSQTNVSSMGVEISSQELTRLYPFPAVVVADRNRRESGFSDLQATLLLLNGTSHVIMNLFPTDPKVQRIFSQNVFRSLSSGSRINESFRNSILALAKQPDFSQSLRWAPFYKYGP